MGVLMDVSSGNSGVETGKEVAVYLPAEEKTFNKTRIITYSPGISKPIFTDMSWSLAATGSGLTC
jgi:hypothetical protein